MENKLLQTIRILLAPFRFARSINIFCVSHAEHRPEYVRTDQTNFDGVIKDASF